MTANVAEEATSPASAPLPPDTPVQRRPTRAARRERAALDALRTLIRDLYWERFGAVPPRAGELTVDLRLRVRPDPGWELQLETPLVEQVLRQLDEAATVRDCYRAGRVFCFRCDSSACEHAAPPSPLAVFKGYTATGTAEWQDLHQSFLEARDARVDQLFADPPVCLARVQLGHELRVRQLSSFGRSSRSYALLGQVVAGYLPLPRAAAAADGGRRLAVTFQIVETRDRNGELCLKLNTLAGLSGGADLEELLADGWAPWVYRARELARRHLERLETLARAARARAAEPSLQAVMRRVPAVLRRLAEFLERGFRQGQRRTRHVEVRRQDRRPVHKALDDLRAAPTEKMFHDERSAAYVVYGPQGRVHVFSPAGRHVTSFTLRPDAVEHRLRTRRWRPATPAEIRDLRGRFDAHDGGPVTTP